MIGLEVYVYVKEQMTGNLIYICKCNELRLDKSILKNNKIGGFAVIVIKIYCKATIVWY